MLSTNNSVLPQQSAPFQFWKRLAASTANQIMDIPQSLYGLAASLINTSFPNREQGQRPPERMYPSLYQLRPDLQPAPGNQREAIWDQIGPTALDPALLFSGMKVASPQLITATDKKILPKIVEEVSQRSPRQMGESLQVPQVLKERHLQAMRDYFQLTDKEFEELLKTEVYFAPAGHPVLPGMAATGQYDPQYKMAAVLSSPDPKQSVFKTLMHELTHREQHLKGGMPWAQAQEVDNKVLAWGDRAHEQDAIKAANYLWAKEERIVRKLDKLREKNKVGEYSRAYEERQRKTKRK